MANCRIGLNSLLSAYSDIFNRTYLFVLARRQPLLPTMKCVFLLLCLSVTAYGANTACWTLDQIADEIIKQTDLNKDGILSEQEFVSEFINKWSPAGSNNGTCLSFHDFTTNWIHNYHDHHDTAHRFFNNLDINNDTSLCIMDVKTQLLTFDTNPNDQQIEPAEFRAFLHAVHPDSHQNGGHGHGC